MALAGAATALGGDWVPLAWSDLGLCALAALGVAAGYIAFVAALAHGELSFVATFRYTAIPMAMLLGFAVWGDVPTARMLAGAALIMGSGLYIVWRERQVARVPPRRRPDERVLPLSLAPPARQHRPGAQPAEQNWSKDGEPALAAHAVIAATLACRRSAGRSLPGRRSGQGRRGLHRAGRAAVGEPIHKALNAAKERGEITYEWSENVANTDYERVMREYAEAGNQLIVGEVFGVERAARRSPRTIPRRRS